MKDRSKGKGGAKAGTVTLVRSKYQPSKAELREKVDLRKPDGGKPTCEELGKALMRPVNVRWKDRP